MKHVQLFTLSLLILFTKHAQAQKSPILIADYTMTQYSSLNRDSMPGAPHELVEGFRKFSKETGGHYQLLYNTETKTYIFKLKDNFFSDMDGANLQFNARSNLKYSVYFQDKTYIKDDILNSNIIYSSVSPDTMKKYWTITNEHKRISGLDCTKAIFRCAGDRAIAWFANDIPIMFSPDLYVGLPGLVVQLEDAERTFVLDKLQYSDAVKEFQSEYSKAVAEIKKAKPAWIKSAKAIFEQRKKSLKTENL